MRAVLVARQPGTGVAFIALARSLNSPVVFAYPSGLDALEGCGAVAIERFTDVEGRLADVRADVLITGTSSQADVPDDVVWWKWARQAGVRSVAFVDQWVNYWQRFSTAESPRWDAEQLPDVIAIVDEVARARMREYGCPKDRLVVTGTPLLDLLACADAAEVERVRSDALARNPGAGLVVFADEPERGSNTGHSSKGALEAVKRALDRTGMNAELVVRPHPRQKSTEPRVDRVHQILAADVVVGLGSILLYESASAGIPTVSVTLGATEPPDVVRAGPAIRSVRDAEELPDALAAALRRGRPAENPLDGHATERFLTALGLEHG